MNPWTKTIFVSLEVEARNSECEANGNQGTGNWDELSSNTAGRSRLARVASWSGRTVAVPLEASVNICKKS